MSTKNPVDELIAIGEQVVEQAMKGGATVAEAVTRQGSHLSVRVRMRETELVEEAGSRGVGIRVMRGQQVAVSYTSDLSKAGLKTLVDDALELAMLSQADSFAGPPDPSLLSKREDHPDLELFDPKMNELLADEAIALALRAEAAALDADPRITNSDGGSMSRQAGASAIVTSGGFRGGYQGTYASMMARPIADDADGKKRRGYHWTAKRFRDELASPEEVGREATRRTVRMLGAEKVATQEAPVVFDPDEARGLLDLLASCAMGGSIWRRSSYLVDRLGTQVASPLVTLVDNPLIPRAPGSRPYDGEGLRAQINTVVEDGILKTYLMDSYSARKLGMQSTASASRGGSGGVGASTSNFMLKPGNQSPEEIIRSTKRGLYVISMMGYGFNAVTGDFSRGASGFWIENGEITHPVSEITISLNIDELFKRIDAVGNDLDLRTSTASPTFRVSAMTIAGK